MAVARGRAFVFLRLENHRRGNDALQPRNQDSRKDASGNCRSKHSEYHGFPYWLVAGKSKRVPGIVGRVMNRSRIGKTDGKQDNGTKDDGKCARLGGFANANV